MCHLLLCRWSSARTPFARYKKDVVACRLSVEKWPYRLWIYPSIGTISLITFVKRFWRRIFGADWNLLLVRSSSDFNTNNQIYIQTLEDYRRCWNTGHISHLISFIYTSATWFTQFVHISLKDHVFLVNVNEPKKTLGIIILILIKNNICIYYYNNRAQGNVYAVLWRVVQTTSCQDKSAREQKNFYSIRGIYYFNCLFKTFLCFLLAYFSQLILQKEGDIRRGRIHHITPNLIQ